MKNAVLFNSIFRESPYTSAILVYDFRTEYLQLATKYQLYAVDEIQGSILNNHDSFG